MPTKLKFKFTNEDDVHDGVHQAYPMEEYYEDGGSRRLRRTTRLASRREPRATEERYVRKVKIEEVTTNDSTVSLHGAMRSTFDFLQLIFGFGAAGLVLYFMGDAFSFAVKVVVTLAAFVAGFMFIKELRSGDGDKERARR